MAGNCTYPLELGPLQINYLEFHYCVMAGHPWISLGVLCMWLLLLFYLGAPDVFSSLATSTSGTMATGLNALLGGVMFVTTVVVGASLHASPTSCVKITPRPFCRDVLALLLTLLVLIIDLPSSTTSRTSAYVLLGCYVVYVSIVIVPSWCSQRKAKASAAAAAMADDAQGVLFAFWHAPNLFPLRSKQHSHSYDFVTLSDPHSPPLKTTFATPWTAPPHIGVHPPPTYVDDTYFPPPLPVIPSTELARPLLSPHHQHLTSPSSFTSTTLLCRVRYVLFQLVRDVSIPMVLVTTWSRRHAFLSLLVTPPFIAWVLTGDAFTPDVACLTLVLSMPVATAVYATTYSTTPPTAAWVRGLFYLLGFASCVCWIYGLASEVIAVLSAFGDITKLPPSVLGLTVLSWGNSVGDLSTNVAIARGGCAEMALAGCFGGPVFNLLVGLGVPLAVWGGGGGAAVFDVHGLVSVAALGLSLSLTLAVAVVTGFQCPKWYASVLYAVYATYTLVHGAILLGWVNLASITTDGY
ncbi:hypothetical protein DYB37_008296 [Aphanomyces astaci]|uniref:Sodium/calcium exchanger membrane region domain-containing protein n=1 Tax=Aphanomyces astaci TaxID=112090 RepID=A0A418EP50_APHAT|nr:hypothetical protein DYB35_008801 [Aphanomyces astaci]RHZ16695.1 hypothetical protein DYB37_008296 [Aphanomyces astaci]